MTAQPASPLAKIARSPRTRSVGVLLAVLLVASVVVSALPARARPRPAAAAPPYAVGWLCPVVPGASRAVVVTNPGTTAAALRSTLGTASGTNAGLRSSLPAGGQLTLPTGSSPGYLDVEATGGPVVPTGQPSCVPGAAGHWWLAGADTRDGAVTRLVIADPGAQDAVVQITLHTASGPLSYPWLQSRIVPAGSVLTLSFPVGQTAAALQPAIEVTALSGRVVAGAAVTYPTSSAVVPAKPGTKPQRRVAVTAPPPLALVPQLAGAAPNWFAGSGTQQAALLVGNLGNAPLTLLGTVLAGGAAPQQIRLGSTPVLPGATATVPLRLGAGGPWALSVSATAGGPFVATLLTVQPAAGSTMGEGVLDGGVPGPQRHWILPDLPAGSAVVLANPATRAVVARVAGLRGAGRATRLVVPALGAVASPVPPGSGAVVDAGGPGVVAGVSGGGQVIWRSLAGGVDPEAAVRVAPVAAP